MSVYVCVCVCVFMYVFIHLCIHISYTTWFHDKVMHEKIHCYGNMKHYIIDSSARICILCCFEFDQ